MDKKHSRMRRRRATRAKIARLALHRLCIHRTPRHIYAQVIDPTGGQTLASASTVEPGVRAQVGYGGNASAATVVGRLIAERSREHGIEEVAFDRSGFRYHGRLKALAESAREHGLKF